MMKLLIATHNPSKLRFMKELLSGAKVTCVSPAELGLRCDAPETAPDAAGNALEKAQAWYKVSGLPVYAEDSGLVFLDLPRNHPDQPGVHVRRIGDITMDDDAMREYYRQLAHQHGGKLRCAWQSANCLLFSQDDYAIYADDDMQLERRAFILTDCDNGKRMPGWPLESLKSTEDSVLRPEDRAKYRAIVGDWLRYQIACRNDTLV